MSVTLMTELEELKAKLEELQQEITKAREETLNLAKEKDEQFRRNPPIGSIIFFASEQTPGNEYLLCDGRELNRSEFKELYDVIGTIWGAGDGSSTFNIPDLRGVFPRFLDLGRKLDENRSLGVLQTMNTAMPQNPFINNPTGEHTHNIVSAGDHIHTMDGAGNHSHSMQRAGNHQHEVPWDLGRTGEPHAMARIRNRAQTRSNEHVTNNSGNHLHTINADGNHRHRIFSEGEHGHQARAAENHNHSLTGGDAETRPINQALVGFIRI